MRRVAGEVVGQVGRQRHWWPVSWRCLFRICEGEHDMKVGVRGDTIGNGGARDD